MRQFFNGIGKIEFAGPKSKDPLSFKHYNPKGEGRVEDDAGTPAVLRRVLAYV